jgi:uncharacterized membrane protein
MSTESLPTPHRARAWLLPFCYAAFLGVLPLLFARRDPEVQWHARNGLVLFLALAAAGTVATLVGILVPSLSCVYAVTMAIAGFLYVMIALLATVKAMSGQRLIIPGVSRYASRAER